MILVDNRGSIRLGGIMNIGSVVMVGGQRSLLVMMGMVIVRWMVMMRRDMLRHAAFLWINPSSVQEIREMTEDDRDCR